ncbi:YciI family protein [Arthrobacter sp. H20]|uniref:YciI family protein n=1 Tax=Arthrobacter sp. H20 TaxID=1267981 RepID=UPI00047C8D48|nr:YciI family protein [Arthrobacter sp. H20]
MSVFAVEYVYGPDTSGLRDEHRPAHREWLNSLVTGGRVLSAGAFADGAGALLIFTADDEQSLNNLLRQDPFALEGAIAAVKATEWKPGIGQFAHYV